MKAIQTRILPATDTKPTRIKASAEGVKSITVSRDEVESDLLLLGDPVNEQAIHRDVAARLCVKYTWSPHLASGGLPNGDWAHCFKS